jgi:CheY-like chemotaxis protein
MAQFDGATQSLSASKTAMRPTILVAEPEPLQALSVRKLVLETAKFNVLTAHSTHEAMEFVEEFPKISAAVLVAEDSIDCEQIAGAIHKKLAAVPIIALSPREGFSCPGAHHNLSSHKPEELVEVMRQLFGDPRAVDGR